jgi:small subunit ribosomal protein S6
VTYECLFLFDSNRYARDPGGCSNEIQGAITGMGGEILVSRLWAEQKLAYPIKKKSSGFYSLFQFQAEGTFINDFEIAFKRDERILRFLTVSLDKFSLEYAEKRRTRRAEMKNNRDNKQVETV